MNKKISFIMPMILLEDHSNISWRNEPNSIAIIRFRLMIKSFIKMFKQSDLAIFIIICPKNDMNTISKLLKDITKDKRYVVLDENELLKDSLEYIKQKKVNGWILQQLLKLAICNYIPTSFYITLDSDIICTKPSNYNDFITKEKAIIGVERNIDYEHLYTLEFSKIESQTKQKRYNPSASKLLGYNRSEPYVGISYSETPVVMHTKSVQNLLSYLTKRFNSFWILPLLTHPGWTEYSLYFQFLEMSNSLEKHYILSHFNSILDLEKSIWHANEKYRTKREYDKKHFKNFKGFFIAIQSWLPADAWLPTTYENIELFYIDLEKWILKK